MSTLRTPVSELLTRCIDYVSFASIDTEISEQYGHTTYEVTEEDLSHLRSGEVMVLAGTDYVNLVVGKDLESVAEVERWRVRLKQRRIEKPCSRCAGLGSRYYSNTSGWRGGMGGASMTRDVCDVCWGSGDEANPFEDLRAMRERYREEVLRASFADWVRIGGLGMSSLRSAIPHMIEALDPLLRRRKNPLDFCQQRAVEILVKRLDEMNAVAAEEAKEP
jgi:hypothetical protein